MVEFFRQKAKLYVTMKQFDMNALTVLNWKGKQDHIVWLMDSYPIHVHDVLVSFNFKSQHFISYLQKFVLISKKLSQKNFSDFLKYYHLLKNKWFHTFQKVIEQKNI